MASTKTATKKPTATGTAVATRKPTSGAVVDIQAKLREQALAMSERTQAATGNKIMPGNDKMFKLPDGRKVPELMAVIVDFVAFHAFYERPFDPKNIVAPGCYAVGTNPKDMAPTDKSPNLQSATCQTCPMNEFGSSGDGKACKNGRRLALLPPNDAGDDVDHEAEMMILDVSPTALKGFDGYVRNLATTYQQPPVCFLTRISFDTSVDYAKVLFSDPQPISSIAEAFARQEEAKGMLMQLPDFSSWVDPNASRPAANTRGAAAGRAPARAAGGRR